MRKSVFSAISIFAISICFGQDKLENNQILISLLYSNSDWTIIKKTNDSVNISIKELDNSDLYAIKVDKTINIEPEQITDVIMDVKNYNSFLSNTKYLKSQVIEQNNTDLIGYQYIRINLLFFDDREYFFRMSRKGIADQDSTTMCFWKLLEPFDNNRTIKSNEDITYIEYGAGIWKSEHISPGKNKISYSLYMDPGGSIPDFIVDKINEQSILGLFQDAVNEAFRRKNANS
tara:strand:+ start:1327 stop:2022 length:696 start_codon:yes stop_codon:yes gene_type:complete